VNAPDGRPDRPRVLEPSPRNFPISASTRSQADLGQRTVVLRCSTIDGVDVFYGGAARSGIADFDYAFDSPVRYDQEPSRRGRIESSIR
jgi:hypothetical protein